MLALLGLTQTARQQAPMGAGSSAAANGMQTNIMNTEFLDRATAQRMAGRFWEDEVFESAADDEGRVSKAAFAREVRRVQVRPQRLL